MQTSEFIYVGWLKGGKNGPSKPWSSIVIEFQRPKEANTFLGHRGIIHGGTLYSCDIYY